MTEKQQVASLIAGCRRHDESSQLRLYRHYYSYGMSICIRYARKPESAMEILNDGFLKVFKKIDQYDDSYPFKPWLRKILVNAAIDYYRKYEQDKTPIRDNGRAIESTYNEALDQLEYQDLLRLMQALPSAYRMVFNLYVVEGLPHAEIAQQLGISIGTSKSNLAKARKKMKQLVSGLWDIHIKPKS